MVGSTRKSWLPNVFLLNHVNQVRRQPTSGLELRVFFSFLFHFHLFYFCIWPSKVYNQPLIFFFYVFLTIIYFIWNNYKIRFISNFIIFFIFLSLRFGSYSYSYLFYFRWFLKLIFFLVLSSKFFSIIFDPHFFYCYFFFYFTKLFWLIFFSDSIFKH